MTTTTTPPTTAPGAPATAPTSTELDGGTSATVAAAPGPVRRDTGTMRAVVIERTGGPEQLTATRVPLPSRLASEVLVRVVAAGVDSVDAECRAGRGDSAGIGAFPAVLGRCFSGVVVEGPYASHPLRPGDAVFGTTLSPRGSGSYAEHLTVPAMAVAHKPTSLSHVEAAAVPLAALTAWGMVVEVAKAHQGQRILVQAAAGGVGHLAVQLASHFGAHVVAVGSPSNAGWLRSLGADEVVDRSSTDLARTVRDVDVVLGLVDDVRVALASAATLRRGGLLVHAPARSLPEVLAGAAATGVRATGYEASPDAAALSVVARLLDAGDLSVHVDDVYALEDAAEAHARLERRHVRGRLVLAVSEE